MRSISRRGFLTGSIAAGLAPAFPGLITRAAGRSGGPNETVRVAVIGMGSTTAVGGVGGRGHQLIGRLRQVDGARIVALCDVDPSHLDREVKTARDHEGEVKVLTDMHRVFEDKDVDAVIVALPNHWHALATVWACQAGKDVYVEKPFSYDIWEGRQMVAAARKYGRMVQVGTQNRSSTFLKGVFHRLNAGEIGSIRCAHALVYRPREGLGTVDAPTPSPESIDYDQWCGPAPKGPLKRKQLHYEWHWFWDTGNGEMGNNGIHMIDICRWGLKQDQTPPRALSVGGRFGFRDCGETANTHIALFDYRPAPLICEVRNLSAGKDPDAMGNYRGRRGGIVIDCEGGHFAGDASGGAIFDRQGKKVQDLTGGDKADALEKAHLSSFLAAVRSRRAEDLKAEALQGHLSTSCCHMANVSHRLGMTASPEKVRCAIGDHAEMAEAFDRCRDYLRKNGVELNHDQATLGPWVTLDAASGLFVGDHAEAANALSRRDYRERFVVPEISGG